MWAAVRRLGLALQPALARHKTKVSGGSAKKTGKSNPKYLGIKIYGDQFAKAGSIIMRQRGAKYRPGENAGIGRDYTIYAKVSGFVEFVRKRLGGYNNSPYKTWIHVIAHSREEHKSRVRQRVAARKERWRNGDWHRTQRGEFAHRGEPKSLAAAEQQAAGQSAAA